MSHPENLIVGAQRTRRNVVKMGAVLAPVVLAGIKPGHAKDCDHKECKTYCFLKGTKIQTSDGECKVENLAVGDLLPTVFGGTRPIQWIGRYPIKKSDPSKPWVKDALPVRIARSALAPNVPHADLYVTAEHALLLDGALVTAGSLINDTTIERYEAREYGALEFFHIRLETHDVIYAEGAPVETLLNVDERAVNFAEYFRRYGTPTTEETRCAPYVSDTRVLSELKSRVRSAMSPWLDRREQFDVIRDRLEERGIALSRQSEPAC